MEKDAEDLRNTPSCYSPTCASKSSVPPLPCPDFSQPLPWWLLPPPLPGTPPPDPPRNQKSFPPTWECAMPPYPYHCYKDLGVLSPLPPYESSKHGFAESHTSAQQLDGSHFESHAHLNISGQKYAHEDDSEAVEEMWELSESWAERFALTELRREERRRERAGRLRAPRQRPGAQRIDPGSEEPANEALVDLREAALDSGTSHANTYVERYGVQGALRIGVCIRIARGATRCELRYVKR
ncbi:hypothetical protein CYMTET_8094 [Cymbomonas tetramitiformis]|uniref:Uncharacterized protein n=1 Tax=Cymbomonas tetramitiformis TaxID=36881 RepID=A0AAE0GTW3_9CHLO|nr:hypothetical protein CYMTET_8094 [Cymbomonas tetramitiformis]